METLEPSFQRIEVNQVICNSVASSYTGCLSFFLKVSLLQVGSFPSSNTQDFNLDLRFDVRFRLFLPSITYEIRIIFLGILPPLLGQALEL